MIRRALALWLIVAAAGSGCSVVAPMPSSSSPTEPSQEPETGAAAPPPAEQPVERSAEPPGGAATASLLAVGRSARAAGDYEGAAAYFEQALRIAPNDARLWIELGETRLVQGDAAQAEMMGRKALTLTGGDTDLETRARRLVRAN